MSDSAVTRIQDWLRAHEAELLHETREIIRIPSIEGEPAPNAPFGQACRDALDRALNLASGWGMRTKDLDGYIGYAETGQGDRLLLVLGHLDVVPVGPGWHYDPFGAEIADNYIYGRGTTDDKGPTMAALFAARAITECFPELNARIRIAFGCNEESGFKCVQRYVQTEESPTFGIAPDAMWPLCHAEKGISNITVRAQVPSGAFKLVKLEGGQRPNIVMDTCIAEVHVDPTIRESVEAKLADKWDRNVDVSWDDEILKIKAIGKAAHGAMPQLGDSSASRMFRFLLDICPTEAGNWFELLVDMSQNNGAGLGIAGVDEVSRDLTSNLGIASLDDGVLKLLFNVRYPVTWKGADLRAKLDAQFVRLGSGWEIAGFTDSPSLYFPLEHPLVKTICNVVLEETGDDTKPGVMGGGTYARAVANTVAIGTSWAGDGKAHETDERIKVDSLYRASRIYANILYRLATI